MMVQTEATQQLGASFLREGTKNAWLGSLGRI